MAPVVTQRRNDAFPLLTCFGDRSVFLYLSSSHCGAFVSRYAEDSEKVREGTMMQTRGPVHRVEDEGNDMLISQRSMAPGPNDPNC